MYITAHLRRKTSERSWLTNIYQQIFARYEMYHTGRNSNTHTFKCSKSFGSELASSPRGGRRSRNAHVFALDPSVQEQKEDGKSLHCQQMIRMLWKILHLSCVDPWSSDTLTKNQDMVVGL